MPFSSVLFAEKGIDAPPVLDNTSTVRFVTTGSGAVDALVVQMGQQTMTLKKVK